VDATPLTTLRSIAVWRVVSALLALVGLLFQGSTAGHMLLVEHARCAEHGELVHGEASHAAEPAAEEQPSLRGHREAEQQTGHAHCSHAAERRDAVATVASSEHRAQPRDLEPRVAEGETLVRDGSDRYRLAPKSSPPA
jgi:hypothetical protein